MAQLNRLPDMRARDIRRRVEVIQKKLSDLQELDIPCAFCYSSVRNTGSLFTLGDRRITDVMEKHKNEILKNLIKNERDPTDESKQEIHLILPPLQAPLDELNRTYMQSLILGILKDLGLRWSDPKPQWWPMDVPFSIKGNWTQALRRVVESVYSFFRYDVDTYIAGNLEIYEGEDDEDSNEEGKKAEGEEKGKGEEREMTRKEEQMGKADGEVDDGEETDDALSCAECETSTEEDAFEESRSPSKLENTSSTAKTGTTFAKKEKEHHHLASLAGKAVHSPRSSTSGLHMDTHSHSLTPTSKTVSSFTVENILMGNTSRSNSTSSGSPTSAPHASTTTFLPFTPHSSSSGSTSTPVSPASTNWTSHPPVKYTKFTMVSPSSMRSGADKRKKGERDKTLSSSTLDTNYRLQLPTTKEIRQEEGTCTSQAANCKEEPISPAVTSVAVRMPALSTASHHPQLTYHHSVIQTAVPAIPLSRQSSSQSLNAASPRICPISPTTVTSFTHAQTQSPHQQQQYVVFFPPHLTLMTAPTDMQVIGQANASQLHVQSAIQPMLSNHNHKAHKHTSPHPSISPSPPPNNLSISTSSSINHSARPTPGTSSNASYNHSSSVKMSDPRYHPIAPRAVDSSGLSFRTVKSGECEQGLRKIGPKSVTAMDKTEVKKAVPKQKKLRFHMTTVVKKVRRRSSSVSLTAPPPSLCDRLPSGPNHKEPKATESENSTSHKNDVQNQLARYESNSKSTTEVNCSHPSASPPKSQSSSHVPADKNSNSLDPRPPSSDSQASMSTSKPSATGTLSSSHTTMQKDPGFHQQLVRNQSSSSLPPISTDSTISTKPPVRGRGRGRRSRGYTRRKRELTFHLYEDPSTSFRAKRTRQQN